MFVLFQLSPRYALTYAYKVEAAQDEVYTFQKTDVTTLHGWQR